jgi:hypothetical protein
MTRVLWSFPRHIRYERQLRQTAVAWFASKGYAVSPRYKYILADRDHWAQNIILPEVAAYIEAQKIESEKQSKPYPLHKYIHHGLSSQAMLFNLIGPLIVWDDLEPLKLTFNRKGIRWPGGNVSASFEHEDRSIFNETRGQPTSIDLVIWSGGTPKIFVEGKLVEKGFGGCSVFAKGDCDGRNPAGDFELCYLHHIQRRYWTLMEKHGFLEGPLAQDSACIMASYYQFFREVLFALEAGGIFVLLCDQRSPTFAYQDGDVQRGLMPFLLSVTPEKLQDRIKVVYIQDVLKAFREISRHEWVGEFSKKYGLLWEKEK